MSERQQRNDGRPDKPFRVYTDEEGDMLALTQEEQEALHGKQTRDSDNETTDGD